MRRFFTYFFIIALAATIAAQQNAQSIAHQRNRSVNIDPKKTLFLIDGSSFLYRAYYSLKPLHTPNGEPIQAVYSFCRMLKKLIDTFTPHYMVVAWDSKGKTVRHEIYQDYKATRQAAPNDLFEQKARIIEFLDLIHIKQVAHTGVEADDLMYSIAKDFSAQGLTVVLVTSDKDMGQALDANIVMFDPFKDVFIDVPAFEKKMGFPVEKLPFYFALLGDTSDNIPGVRGVGEKTATEIVQQFDSLEDLYANLHKVAKARISAALAEQKENAFLSRKLFLLQYQDLAIAPQDTTYEESRWIQAQPLFNELGFKSLLAEMGVKAKEVSAEDKIEFLRTCDLRLVTTQEQLQEVVREIQAAKFFAIDTEGTGLKALECDMVGLSISTTEKHSYYIPFGHKIMEQQLTYQEVKEALKPFFEDAAYKKYMHHAKYDMLVLSAHGIQVEGLAFDTLVAASLLVKDWQRAGLKYLSVQYFNEQMLTFDDVVKQKKYKDFSYVPLDIATYYAANDARQTLRLLPLLQDQLEQENMVALYNDIEFPLVRVLYEMEKVGIPLDVDVLKHLSKDLEKELALVYEQILGFVPADKKDFNVNSPKQVEMLLFDTLGLPTQKKSAKKTGYSTDQSVLSELSKLHPAPGLILKYRELYKLKSTYVDALPTYVNPKTGCIHTNYSQTSVATGRLASSEPNLQNIPADASGYGIQIRKAFKPQPGHVFLSADYSQIELRVLAHLSQDPVLIKAFLGDHDIHAQTAAGLFDVSLEDVSHEHRQIGKRINFSILYGLTPYGLSKDLGISFSDAKFYIEKYFAQYPKVSSWMEGVLEETKENGYVTTLWGRRRYIPGIYEKNRTLYEEACRVAINTKAQGTAAEIMKKGMIALSHTLKESGVDAHIVLQIHDELVISVAEKDAQAIEKIVKQTLEAVVDWNIPLQVSTRIGRDWMEITK